MGDLYVLMNDFKQPNIALCLDAYIDITKKSRNGSDYHFPYYMAEPQCPDELFLIAKDNERFLKFDYYFHGGNHIVSSKMSELIDSFRHAAFIRKQLIPIDAATGSIITTEEKYYLLYFNEKNKFINMALSVFEETNIEMLMPVKYFLNENINKFDVFELEKAIIGNKMETFIGGSIIINSDVKKTIDSDSSEFIGIKCVALDNAFSHFCKDHGFDINSMKKPKRPKLP